jgi:predicted transcriptional regulator
MANYELLQETVDALQQADFEVYYNEGLRRYFDLIAVKDFKLFVKVLVNIDNLGPIEGTELKRFANAFSSQSFVIGEKAGIEFLADDVVYQRHGNSCVNLPTFRKILRGESVSKFTKRGQFLVGIDGDELRRLREQRGLSQEDLASVLECTGQTVYRMEKQNRAQEDVFEKLIDYFGRGLDVGAVELKEPTGRVEIPISDPIKREIVKEYLRLKLENMAFQTPIDFALEEKPILTPVSRTEAELRSKQRIAKGLSDVLDCSVIHITREQRKRRICTLSFEELHSISSKDEIFEKSE